MFTLLKEVNKCLITVVQTISTILKTIANEVEADLGSNNTTTVKSEKE